MRQHSKLINDLMDLEESFKHNLNLLKIKSSEIDRCNAAVKRLEEVVESDMGEMAQLKCTIKALETKLCKSENEAHFCKESLGKLQRELSKTKHDMKAVKDKFEADIARSKLCMEDENGRKNEFISDIRAKLQQEQAQYERLKKNLDELLAENQNLRENLRRLESRHLTERTVFENELSESKAINKSLETELQCLKDNLKNRQEELEQFKRHKDDLLRSLAQERKTSLKSTHTNEHLNAEMKNKAAICARMNEQIRQLGDELDRYKSAEICQINEHRNYEEIRDQTSVLQEVVKAMRKERNEHLESLKSMGDAEKRIQLLETALEMLKQNCNNNELRIETS